MQIRINASHQEEKKAWNFEILKKNLDPGSGLDQKLNKNRSSSTKCLSQVQKHAAKEIKEQEKHTVPESN